MTGKYTGRPWKFRKNLDGTTAVYGGDETPIAETSGPNRHENGRLIAAAPDLHWACSFALTWLEGFRDAYKAQGSTGPDLARLEMQIGWMRDALAKVGMEP